MKEKNNMKRTRVIFIVTLCAIIVCFAISIIKTHIYNSKVHTQKLSGDALFFSENTVNTEKDVSVSAVARSDTWTKLFDFNNEGLTENNYQAYTYDFNVNNNTKDEVLEFSFKLTFDTEVLLASAWNGALEIHQNVADGEITATIPDLRVFEADGYQLKTVTAEERDLVIMEKGDYLIYKPSSSANAMEIPIEPLEGTTPGCILYVAIGSSIENSTLELEYRFNRKLTSEMLFTISTAGAAIWIIALVTTLVTLLKLKKYMERHERDNKIINESIETFTGFIDAKDPYTNGHSKRVAIYARMIAKELGYSDDDLERIYYIGLLHDCGKIGVPDSILGKPGKLTAEEFEIIKTHTTRGAEILSSFKSLENAADGAHYHHERYDGKGYPEGKAGEDIPLIARIICVADAFDAMNTNRVYRNRLTKEQLIDEIEKNSGLQFDPVIAEIMLRFIRNGDVKAD